MDALLLKQLAKITDEEQSLLDGNALEMQTYASGNNAVIDSAKMLERGQLITIRPHTRFAPFPRHRHNYVEIMYMCNGSTTHSVNGKNVITLQKGELLFLNQHATHAIEQAGESDIAINFMVLPEFFDVALSMIGPDNLLSNFLISSLRQNIGDITFLHFQVSDILPIQNLVENLIWSIANHQPNHRRIHQFTMGLLFQHLLNNTERLAVSDTPRSGNALVLTAMRAIEETYKTASLTDIAETYHVSVAYLSRLMKQSTGETFKELLQVKRLSKAAQLLRESPLTVQDIIMAVGYDNTSYFYRIFKKQYGVSPKEYRSAALRQP